MNTIKYWFSLIEDSVIREKALKNTKPENLNRLEQDLLSSFINAFRWGDTPEGEMYWDTIYESVKNGILPLLNTSSKLTSLPEKYQIDVRNGTVEDKEILRQWISKKYNINKQNIAYLYYYSDAAVGSNDPYYSNIPMILLSDWVKLIKNDNKKQNKKIIICVNNKNNSELTVDKEYTIITETEAMYTLTNDRNIVAGYYKYRFKIKEEQTNNFSNQTNQKQTKNEGNKITSRSSVRITTGERPKGNRIEGKKIKTSITSRPLRNSTIIG